MKKHIRILGIDDSEFRFSDKTVPVVGVVMRIPDYVEAVMKTQIEVDGRDANDAIIRMLLDSRYKSQLRVVLIDGVTLGGFNVIDIVKLYKETGIPVATVTRKKPDLESMKKALTTHFGDWEERWEIISRGSLERMSINEHTVHTSYKGIDHHEMLNILSASVVKGAIPEPLRMAHLIATALARGESRGRV